jgi:hypothetical protein
MSYCTVRKKCDILIRHTVKVRLDLVLDVSKS